MYGRAAAVFRGETWAAVPRTCAQMGVALLAEPPTEHITAIVPTDDDLIALVLAGRGDAFGTLVERYERAVYHLAYRTMREVEEAKDACQEAWMKAYRALASFRPGAKFATWIFTICYRVCCDPARQAQALHGRRTARRCRPRRRTRGRVRGFGRSRPVREAIAGLPEKYRTVITPLPSSRKAVRGNRRGPRPSARNREDASFSGKRPVTGRTGANRPTENHMTDDELDRALFALPLEEPPADLHGRILAATVLRPAPTFRVWELLHAGRRRRVRRLADRVALPNDAARRLASRRYDRGRRSRARPSSRARPTCGSPSASHRCGGFLVCLSWQPRA